jgi:hypothetical protein
MSSKKVIDYLIYQTKHPISSSWEVFLYLGLALLTLKLAFIGTDRTCGLTEKIRALTCLIHLKKP